MSTTCKLSLAQRYTLGALACLTLLAFSTAAMASERVPNFTLLDQHGEATELHYHRQASAIVLLGHRNGSPVVQQSAQALEALQAELGEQLAVFMLNPVQGEDRGSVRADSDRINTEFPILMDDTQLVAESLRLTYAGETLVIDPKRWLTVYRGPAIDASRSTSADPGLLEAVRGLAAGEPATAVVRSMPADWQDERFELPALQERASHAQISYAETVAPILKEKCASCHREGGIGPWAMTDHRIIQGFSPMIRETILTKRMPPWHADPEVSSFRHDLSLSREEARELVHWIDAGAPRGKGEDPLLQVEAASSEWQLGTPDLIVDLPAFEVPATGVIDYQFFEVANPLDRDVWVRAVEIVPGDRQVVHHAIATFGSGSAAAGQRVDSGQALFQSQLMTFVPGNESYIYPEGTGLWVPAGASFFTQMHYTSYGRETVDQTRIGLYFADAAPEHVLQHHSILNLNLRIPAGVAEHEEAAYFQFQRDAVIYSLFPHAHYRGRSSEFSLRYPDGREELVLSVPNYDFNWQRYFQFEEPLEAPAGTMVIHRTVYDNSTANVRNPDPEKLVRFGEQTWEEMLYGGVSYRYAEPGEDDGTINQQDALTSVAMGFMDTDMNGLIELDEMPPQSRQQLALPFTMMDKGKKGGLDFAEFRDLMIGINGFETMQP